MAEKKAAAIDVAEEKTIAAALPCAQRFVGRFRERGPLRSGSTSRARSDRGGKQPARDPRKT